MLSAAASRSAEHYYHAKRWLARNDLFFLLTAVCRRRDVNHDWLFGRCREVEAAPNDHLDLWAREHYKSTIITFGLSLQDVLASHGAQPEPRYAGREVTIGIFSHTRPAAKQFLRQIKHECEHNQELKALFPDVLWDDPARQAPKWSEDEGLIFQRQVNAKEATIEAWGLVDGMPTGKHFVIRVYDDVVTERSVTPEMIRKTTQAWELSLSLGTEGGWARYIGTRYHLSDTYAVLMQRGVRTRVYPCTADGSEDFSRSVLKAPEYLAAKRQQQGPYTFGAQMLLNPRADTAQGFREEWLRYWPGENFAGLNLYLLVDPASGKKKHNDYTSMWVVGLGGDGNYYVVDGVRDRLNLRQRAKALFRLHRKWRPRGVGYEEYGLQADIEHHEYEMERQNYRFTITPLGGALAKEDRIRRLVPVCEQGRLFLPAHGILYLDAEGQMRDLVRIFRDEEYLTFPLGAHDDMLDALSRILDPELAVVAPEPADDRPQWLSELDEGRSGRDFMTA